MLLITIFFVSVLGVLGFATYVSLKTSFALPRMTKTGEYVSFTMLGILLLAALSTLISFKNSKRVPLAIPAYEVVDVMQMENPPEIIKEMNGGGQENDPNQGEMQGDGGMKVVNENTVPKIGNENSDTSQSALPDTFDVGNPGALDGDGDAVFTSVEVMPGFQGGEAGLRGYLMACPYPEQARNGKIEGTVYVSFIITKEGKVKDVKVVLGAHKWLNESAVKHIQKMPKWTPGKNGGKAVNVLYVVPIEFKLSKD